ncbi:MAG: hypothetical protein AMXMBFR64_62790 [Myxococcales bacterium]
MRPRVCVTLLWATVLLHSRCVSDCGGAPSDSSAPQQGSSDGMEADSGEHSAGDSAVDAHSRGSDLGKDGSASTLDDATDTASLAEVQDDTWTSAPDVKKPNVPDGICPEPDPLAPKAGDPCDQVGATRCSEAAMVGVDLQEKPKQYMCARPNRLVCVLSEGTLRWEENPCPIPPVECNKSQGVTCVEDSVGARCCSTRCRQGTDYSSPSTTDLGPLLCSNPGEIVCQRYPWMVSDFLYTCGVLTDSPRAQLYTKCRQWCEGCNYYHKWEQCPAIRYCQTHCGDHASACANDEEGNPYCVGPANGDCDWYQGDCP